jgi:hypothetical protein
MNGSDVKNDGRTADVVGGSFWAVYTVSFSCASLTMTMITPSLLLLSLIVTVSSTAASSIPRGGGGRSVVEKSPATTRTYWEEEIPPPPSDKDTANKKNDKDSRPLFWTRENKNGKQKQHIETPHPLRTNKWEIRFTTRNRKLFANRTLEIDFDAALGYCKAGSNDETAAAVGKWHMIPSGIMWRYSNADNDSNRLLHFTAEIHLNPFGDHPRMLRGVVVRDRYVLVDLFFYVYIYIHTHMLQLSIT